MLRIRRLVAVVGVTALAGAFTTGPASADTAEAYLGSAAGRSLNLSITNPVDATQAVQATLGAATAKVTSALDAEAVGAGQVLPVLPSTAVEAKANAATITDNPDGGCAAALPENDIVSLGLACGDAEATVANGLPSASSKGSVASLDVLGETAISELVPVDLPIGETLFGLLDTVCTTLEPTCAATDTVQTLVDSILNTQTLDVTLGESTASVVTTAGSVTSTATASGAVVKILPLPQVDGLPSLEPIATIEVGASKASAVYDRAAGTTAEPTADAALARVTFNSTLGLAPITVPVNEDITILEGTPLQSRIIVAGTQVVTNADGTKGAIADGVSLHLLQGLGESAVGALDGGILLELAHAEAGVGGVAPTRSIVPVVNTPDLPRGELPRTGGNPVLPLAGAAVLAVAVIARRTMVKASADS